MICDVSRSLWMAQDTLTAMQAARKGLSPCRDDCTLSYAELDALSYALQLASKAIDIHAGQVLMPLQGTPVLLVTEGLQEQAMSSLRHAVQALGAAVPLNKDSRRMLRGERFLVEAVLRTLDEAQPGTLPPWPADRLCRVA